MILTASLALLYIYANSINTQYELYSIDFKYEESHLTHKYLKRVCDLDLANQKIVTQIEHYYKVFHQSVIVRVVVSERQALW